MNETYEPPVHIIPEGDKWGVCLSRLGKWIAGIAAGVITAVLIGALAFAWNSNEALGRILQRPDSIESRISTLELAVNDKTDRNERRIERLEGRHGL